jgi:putative hemolysin
MHTAILIDIAVLALLLAASAFFSGSESALFSLGPLRRRRLRQQYPGRAERVERLLRDPNRLLGTILIGNTTVNVVASVVGYDLVRRARLPYPEATAIALVTLLLLSLGEIAPKNIALRKAIPVAVLNAPVLQGVAAVIRPLRVVLERVTENVLARAGQVEPPETLDEDEYRTMVRIGRREGVLRPGEDRMIAGILDLDTTNAADVMTPRVDICALDLDDPPQDVPRQLREAKHRLVPVCRGSLDEIAGILNVRDFLYGGGRDLVSELNPPFYVPAFAPLSKVLPQMQTTHHQLAIVVDEYGGTAGLVTIEDILEEIFGEIHDEYDLVRFNVRRTAPGRYRVNARMHLDDLEQRIGARLEEDGVDTVGGYVAARLGRVPKEGDTVDGPGVRLRVRRVEANRVLEVDLDDAPDARPTTGGNGWS